MKRTKYGYFLTVRIDDKQVAFGYWDEVEDLEKAREYVYTKLSEGYTDEQIQTFLGVRKNNTDSLEGYENEWLKVLFETDRVRGYRTYTCVCKVCGHLSDVRSSVLRANPDHSLKCGCKQRLVNRG